MTEDRDSTHASKPVLGGCAIFVIIVALNCMLYLITAGQNWKDKLTNEEFKYVVVNTALGKIRGKETTWEGMPGVVVNEFLGIPYAEDATNYRFSQTQPKKAWNGQIDALKYGPACVQVQSIGVAHLKLDHTYQTENCLHLNIWSPSNTTGNHSVLIFIHGGSFTDGANMDTIYNGSAWPALTSTIMVVINYRLNVFGFLDAQIEEAAGNQGIYDVVEAIRWTHANIEAFGGNPASITLMGESAGSIIISMLAIYEPARKYINQGIMMSGSLFMRNGNILQLQQKLIKYLVEKTCDKEFTTALDAIKCFRQVAAQQLHKTVEDNPLLKMGLFPTGGHRYSMFPHILLDLYNKSSMKPMNLVMGIGRDEGTFFLNLLIGRFINKYINSEKDFDAVSRESVDLILTLSQNLLEIEADYMKRVVNLYIPQDATKGEAVVRGASNLLGDFIMRCPTKYFGEFAIKYGSKVYCYENVYIPDENFFPAWMGACHASDLHFTFGRFSIADVKVTARDRDMNIAIISAFAHFAKTGQFNDSATWMVQDTNLNKCALLNGPALKNTTGMLGDREKCELLRAAMFAPFKNA